MRWPPFFKLGFNWFFMYALQAISDGDIRFVRVTNLGDFQPHPKAHLYLTWAEIMGQHCSSFFEASTLWCWFPFPTVAVAVASGLDSSWEGRPAQLLLLVPSPCGSFRPRFPVCFWSLR